MDLPCVTNCHTWFRRGGRQLWVVAQGKLFTNPALCRLYWNWVRMLDDLMIRGAVMYLCRDRLTIVFCHMHHDVYVIVVRFFKCRPSFLGLEVLVWWLLSLWPCISSPVYHQDTSSLLALWRAVLPSPRTCHMLPWPSPC